MALPPQWTDGAASPVKLQPPSIEGAFLSGEIESVVPSVQVLATDLTSEINRSPDQNEPSGEIEAVLSTTQGLVAELRSKLKQSPKSKQMVINGSAEMEKYTSVEKSAGMENRSEMEKSAQMKKLLLETGELIDRLDPSGAVLLMCLTSPLYAVLAVWPLLWLVSDQRQALLWRLPHLACLYLFLWIIVLSTTRISVVFFRITYILMLAFTVVHLIGPANGMIFLYTGMVYVAGMLGYAVAEHFHRSGFEQTANTLCNTPFNRKDSEEHVSLMRFCIVLMSTPVLARMVWVFLGPTAAR
ncbi:hypothetical protein ACQ4PT_029116 [Festuca glaucescens]